MKMLKTICYDNEKYDFGKILVLTVYFFGFFF